MNQTTRTKIFKVRLSFTEYAAIKKKAKAAGRNPSRFMREASLGIDIIPRQLTEEEKQNYRVMAGLANNLNQIAKAYNQGNRMHFELQEVLSEIRMIIKKLISDVRED